jgi:hypothetical protein
VLEPPDLVAKLGSGRFSSELPTNLALQLCCVLNRCREPALLAAERNEGTQYDDLVFRAPDPGRTLALLHAWQRRGSVAALGAALGGAAARGAARLVHQARADGLDVGGLHAGGATRVRERRRVPLADVFGGDGVVGVGVGVEPRRTVAAAPRGGYAAAADGRLGV